jgi:uncharacterized protein involved in exopolysaccharide biosynthesis
MASTDAPTTPSRIITGPAPPPATGNSHGPDPLPAQPVSSPVASAIGRHKLLVCACALALAALGAAGGFARKGTYTAASTLQVGKVNPNSPGFYGFVQSASDLAAAFSRAVTAAPVLKTVHRRLGLPAQEAVARLAAEPIPNSPAFRVIATGPTQRAAVDLANVSSRALISYEASANTYSPESGRLLGAYRAASLDLAHARTEVESAASEYAKHPGDVARLKLENAQASRAAATLRAHALAGGYQQSAQSATTRDLISPLSGAVTAVSDRKAKIELFGFVGLLGGLAIGCALAVLWDRGRARLAR